MGRTGGVISTTGLALVIATAVDSGEVQILRVSQVLDWGGSYTVSDVPYGDLWDLWACPGREVMLTTSANSIVVDGIARDLNAATDLGVRVAFAEGSHPESIGLAGDTLRIELHVAESDDDQRQERLTKAAPLFVDCLQRNAARRWPRVRHLDLRLVGVPSLARFTAVYDLQQAAEALHN